jgi:hypothetical protein
MPELDADLRAGPGSSPAGLAFQFGGQKPARSIHRIHGERACEQHGSCTEVFAWDHATKQLWDSNPVRRCLNMSTYLLFGIEGGDLHRARDRLERALGIKMDLHESGYRCGEYYRLGDVGDEHFILQRNFDDLEHEWTEPACREYGLLFYANETDRADFICSALAGVATLVSS